MVISITELKNSKSERLLKVKNTICVEVRTSLISNTTQYSFFKVTQTLCLCLVHLKICTPVIQNCVNSQNMQYTNMINVWIKNCWYYIYTHTNVYLSTYANKYIYICKIMKRIIIMSILSCKLNFTRAQNVF